MSGRNIAALEMVALLVLASLIWLLSGEVIGWGMGSPGSGQVMPLVEALAVGGFAWVGASLLRPNRVAAKVSTQARRQRKYQ